MELKISELIHALQQLQNIYGDLPVHGYNHEFDIDFTISPEQLVVENNAVVIKELP